MTRLALSLVVVGALLTPRPAHATLIDLGNGLIYDTVQDLTWVQDTLLSRTLGHDANGLMSYDEALLWLDGLEYQGYDDWHLARRSPAMGEFGYGSEISGLMYQLGWDWRLRRPEHEDSTWQYFPGDAGVGPFLNFDVLPNGMYNFNSTWVVGMRMWYADREVDLPDRNYDAGRVWAVRDGGNPAARVPEPATLLTLAIGMGLFGVRHRRHRTLMER